MEIINSFPGYEFVRIGDDNKPHNMYRGIDIGFGGYIYANIGMYTNVALLDVQSMHPSSIIALNYFGEYTKTYKDLIDTRIMIKHGKLDEAKRMFGGRLEKYLNDPAQAKALANAIKLSLNSCYGLTAANFDHPMRDIRNVNNIVALRGALFMKTLQDEIEARGFKIVAIRTDSIKIADATPEIIEYCMDFGKKYGYVFEFESHYDRMCQVTDADYVAKYSDHEVNGNHAGEWTVTGAKFAVPYVFKKLFTKESIVFDDLCETKEVKSALYIDMNENLPENEHSYHFVGKVGRFCPIKPGHGGGELLREATDGDGNIKYDSATGCKGYRWLEAEIVQELGKEDSIDRSYYDRLVDAAIYGSGKKGTKAYSPGISDFGDFEWFVSDDSMPVEDHIELPWRMACSKDTCTGCEYLTKNKSCNLGHDNSDYTYAATQENNQ